MPNNERSNEMELTGAAAGGVRSEAMLNDGLGGNTDERRRDGN